MQCPVCKEAQLSMTNRQDIEIDYCPQCRGVWLDRGELDKIIERSGRQGSGFLSQDEGRRAMPSQRDGRRTGHGYSPGHDSGGTAGFLKRLFD